MLKLGQFVPLEAKPGKEEEVAAFLNAGLEMARGEETTLLWMAVRFSKSTFGIIDGFRDEAGRQAHLNGSTAAALMANAPHLFATAPEIRPMDLLGAKLP